MATGAMTAFLSNIGEFFTQQLTWAGNVITMITESPVLMVMCVAIPIVSFGVGLANRLLRG